MGVKGILSNEDVGINVSRRVEPSSSFTPPVGTLVSNSVGSNVSPSVCTVGVLVVGSGETTAMVGSGETKRVGASESASLGADVMVTGERVASTVTLTLGDDDDDSLGEEEELLLGSIEGSDEVDSSPGGQGSIGVSVGNGVKMIEGVCVDKVGFEVGQAGPPHPLPFDGYYMIVKKEIEM